MSVKKIFIGFIAAILFATGSSKAAVLTCIAQGYVHRIELLDDVELDGSVDIGTDFTVSFVYDTDSPDLWWDIHDLGKYNIISIDITVGNYSFYHRPESELNTTFSIDLGLSGGGTTYDVYSADPGFDGTIFIDGQPKTFEDLNWQNFITRISMVKDIIQLTDELPTLDTFPDLSFWDYAGITIAHDDFEGMGIYGSVTSYQVIPEPGTVLLFALGGLTLLRKRRRPSN